MSHNFFQRIRSSVQRRGALGSLTHAIRHVGKAIIDQAPARKRLRAEHAARDAERRMIREMQSKEFDLVRGVDTRGTVPWEKLDVRPEDFAYKTRYQGINPEAFRETISQLPIRFEEYTFVDFGSGKGRAVFLASEFPFRKIVGIELSRQLYQIATANLSTYCSGTQRCKQIELLCMDAVDYVIPCEPEVMFFYNPFGEEIMARVAGNIQESLRDTPREVFIVYFNPRCRIVIDKLKSLETYPVHQPRWEPVALWVSKVFSSRGWRDHDL